MERNEEISLIETVLENNQKKNKRLAYYAKRKQEELDIGLQIQYEQAVEECQNVIKQLQDQSEMIGKENKALKEKLIELQKDHKKGGK